MKKTITIISAVALTMMACSKSGGGGGGTGGGTPPPTTPVKGSKGFIRINFSGKTLEARDTMIVTGLLQPIVFEVKAIYDNTKKNYTKHITITNGYPLIMNGNIEVGLVGMILNSSNNNPIDTYPILGYKVTDLTNSTQYSLDSASSITVTSTSGDYSEGTLKLNLITGSGTIPANGTFKIYSK